MTDYHNFLTIDSTSEERAKYHTGDIWVNATTCGECGDYIRSTNRHDFKWCTCGNVAVDGGSWYVKRCFKTNNYQDDIQMFNNIKETNNG